MAFDFICVGAQKTGTTWLYNQFQSHPQFAMPKKEIGFVQFPKFPVPSEENFLSYKSIFDRIKRMSGDITPYYMIIDWLPDYISTKLPNTKVFAILRNPVDRAFSQFRMLRFLHPEMSDSFLSCFRSDKAFMRTRGEYARLVRGWQSALGDRFKVFFHDDMKANSLQFMNSVCEWLGASRMQSVGGMLRPAYFNDGRKVNPEARKEVSLAYADQIKELSDLVGRQLDWS